MFVQSGLWRDLDGLHCLEVVVDSQGSLSMANASRNSEPDANGGKPPYDGQVEPRLVRIETILEYVHRDVGELRMDMKEMRREQRSDFRMLFSTIVTMAIGMAAMMAKLFNWL
jgi:hypothetical protein